jgi:hypothetical protein
MSRDELMRRFRERFSKLVPEKLMKVGVEPGTPVVLDNGVTLTMALPLRGNVQVRVEEISDRSITFATLEGHPLAGVIRFLFEERGEARRGGKSLHFEVQTYDRSATLADRIVMGTFGSALKHATWHKLVEAVVRESGGEAPDGIQSESEALDDNEAARVEEWVEELVMQRKREE